MTNTKLFSLFLILLLLGDLIFSFVQFYHTPLDGDMAGGIVPAVDVQAIFDDPFGWNAIVNQQAHPNPNRYFSHLFFRDYFRHVPLFFQNFMSPIESVYFSCALIKISLQIWFIYLLASFIGKRNLDSVPNFLLLGFLIFPLLQTYGYNNQMGILDKSITYTFFYGLPIILLMAFVLPFFRLMSTGIENKLGVLNLLFLSILTLVLPFSGPIIPALILIIGLLVVLHYFKKSRVSQTKFSIKIFLNSIPKLILYFFIPIGILSLYSLCLGTLNSTYQTDIISIQERYFNLPFGVFNQFTQKLCFPVLFGLIGINVFIIKKYHHETDGKKIISSLKWIALFSLLYIILLPLGGYRPYRQNILRFDTVMPITICIIYLSACSSYFLWNKLTKNKTLYKGFILTILLIFTNSDRLNLKDNACEIAAFETISTATTSIVPIHSQCKILSWKPINNYQESELNAELLKLWRISNQKKLYFCP